MIVTTLTTYDPRTAYERERDQLKRCLGPLEAAGDTRAAEACRQDIEHVERLIAQEDER